MKLLNKYSRVHILTACAVLLFSSVAYYFIIRTILLKQIDKDLKVEEQEIKDFIRDNNSLPHASDYKHQQIKFEKLNQGSQIRETVNTLIYDSSEREQEPYRRLSFPVTVAGSIYKASVYKSQVETEDLLRLIMLITAILFMVLLALIFIINRFVLGKLWMPFFKTLTELKKFDLHTTKNLSLSKSTIEEFEELNLSVSQMTQKVSNEYATLKSFTDNASHEMQTPLAIITSKLDLLIQSSNENQVDALQAIYDATGRLTKLNQTLLLLSKIDNQQFQKPELVNLKSLVENKFQQFEELIKAKNISVKSNLQSVTININSELIDILLNNLFSNAIKHNYDGGKIECSLTADMLSFINSGPILSFDKENIFDRFQKSSHSDGSGLGLAVVKQICDASGLDITYQFNQQKHSFNISLNNTVLLYAN